MARVALADSNVYIGLLRRGIDPVLWLGDRYEDIYSCGVIRVEVLRGLKDSSVRDRLGGFFDVVNQIPTDLSLWEQAGELAWTLDRLGRILPLSDILIAACARRVGVPVLTADSHFREVPKILIIPFMDK